MEHTRMSFIEMSQVTKDYRLGDTVVHALNGIELEIGAGEFVAVWGPSGSGKTTLLNLIGVIDQPTSGVLRFRGKQIAMLPDNQQSELRNESIGFVFQQFNLIPVLSAIENVMLPLQIMGLSGAEARKRSMHRLNQVELTDFVKQRPDKLSGGQRQRVAIARALVTNPHLIIADEPTANLDTETAIKIIELMQDLNKKEGATFVFSTHDQRLLGNVDRLIHLVDGRIVEK
jgi:putative ABC transport system ATP-binding protein